MAAGVRRFDRLIRRIAALAVLGLCAWLLPPAAMAQSAAELRARHDTLREALAASPFGRPLLLSSGASASEPSGEVHAVIDQPFATLQRALRRPEAWCEVLLLQTNVRRCQVQGEAPAATLEVAMVRRADQPVEDAFQLHFRHQLVAAEADHLSVQMSADEGPLGTRDYRLALEAVPLDARHSFLRMSYRYESGMAARLATDLYLATAGRHKVGFSSTGADESGQPRYVGGVRGAAERNTMRYFLAIEALLATVSVPPDQRTERRRRAWFAAIDRYPRQLRDMDLGRYLALKQQDHG